MNIFDSQMVKYNDTMSQNCYKYILYNLIHIINVCQKKLNSE